ncbi:MAG: hypothetical protein KF774_12340 [Planctomyces sp.]|nr:hypothetical protein [Planctomyces sp.]
MWMRILLCAGMLGLGSTALLAEERPGEPPLDPAEADAAPFQAPTLPEPETPAHAGPSVIENVEPQPALSPPPGVGLVASPPVAVPAADCPCRKTAFGQGLQGFVPPSGVLPWGTPDAVYVPPGPARPVVGDWHVRHPYYNDRRPWYTPGPASINRTILW